MKHILTTDEGKFLAVVECGKDKFFTQLDSFLQFSNSEGFVSAFPELKDVVENAELHEGYDFDTSETIKNKHNFEIGTKINISGDNGSFSLNLLKASSCLTWS